MVKKLDKSKAEQIRKAAEELLRRKKLREKCREDLLSFIEYTHPNWETAEHHHLLCEYLMKLERQEIQNLAVFAPPRHGKSEVVSRRFPAWCMGRNPDWQMICAQANGQLAQDMGANVRDIIASPEFQEIFPDIKLKEDAKAAFRWLIDNPDGADGVYYACGIGGKIIGRGANILNIDDPLDAEGAYSPRQREVAAQFYYGDAIQRLMSPGLQLFTTTRRHEADLAGKILPPPSQWKSTDDPRVYIAEVKHDDYSDKEVWYILNLQAIQFEGTDKECALWPGTKKSRFPLSRLKAIKNRLIEQGHGREWYAQYQQVITPEEGIFCKKSWFTGRYDLPPKDMWIYATSDVAVTSATAAADPDYTEHCVFGIEGLEFEYDRHGNMKAIADTIYVLDWWYGRVTTDVWMDELVQLFKKWDPQVWFGTKGVIRNAVEPFLERELRNNHCDVRVEWISDMANKTAKGAALQRMASRKRILFPGTTEGHAQPDWVERAIQNICSFPNARHDDAYDTAANMVRALIEIPDAFIGDPPKEKEEKLDSYEFIVDDVYESWKTV